MSLKVLRRLSVLILGLIMFAPPAAAYEDIIYDFQVEGPTQWMPLREAVVPGLFRFGWLAPNSVKDRSGANVIAFVQLLPESHVARELLTENVKAASRRGLKVVKQSLFKLGNAQGFVLEVSGEGTGFSLIPDYTAVYPEAKRQTTGKIPTRQRWYAIVHDKQVVALMSTCAETNYSKYAPVFAKVEKSLTLTK